MYKNKEDELTPIITNCVALFLATVTLIKCLTLQNFSFTPSETITLSPFTKFVLKTAVFVLLSVA